MNKQTLFYIGYYVPDDVFNEIVKYKINNMSAARQNLEYGLLKELNAIKSVDVKAVSYVPGSQALNIPEKSYIGNLAVKHIPIKKGNVLSCISAAWKFWKYLYVEVPKGSLVLMYAVNPVFMPPLLFAKVAKRLTLTTICSEVPAFRRYDKSIAMKIKRAIQTFFNNLFDGYVLLTEPMKNVVSVGVKPYIVMEGIATALPEKVDITGRKNIVMYAGGLHPDNNLMLLIDACERSRLVDECWICGSGPQEDEIKTRIVGCSKIKLLGRLSHDEVLDLEKQVKVLVNLRDAENVLTKYSFPSKLIEYLASGAYVVSTRLEGIPAEYFEYVYSFDNQTSEELSNLLDEIISKPESEHAEKAVEALNFLKTYKTSQIQCERIVKFVCQIQ